MIEKITLDNDLELNNKAIENGLLLSNWFLDGMDYNPNKSISILDERLIISKYNNNTVTVYNNEYKDYDEYSLSVDINKVFSEFTKIKHIFFNAGNSNILNENLEYVSGHKITSCPYMESYYIDRNIRDYNIKYLKKHSIYKLSEFIEYKKVSNKSDIEKIYNKWCKIKSLKKDDVLNFSKEFVKDIINNPNSYYDIYGLYFEDEILGLHILKKYNNCIFVYIENVLDELDEDFNTIADRIYETYNNKYPTEYKVIYNKLRNSLKRIMLYFMMDTYKNIRYFNIDCVGDEKDTTLYNYKKIYYGSCNKTIKVTKRK